MEENRKNHKRWRDDLPVEATSADLIMTKKYLKWMKVTETVPIESKIAYDVSLNKFKKQRGLTDRAKEGDLVVRDTVARDIVKLIELHHRRIKQPRNG
jgi:hypothetical protein